MKDVQRLKQTFADVFGETDGITTYFAPGRVNLIGEHTDYNGGHVFPCALDIGTTAIARKRDDQNIRFYSMNFPEIGVIESSLQQAVYREEDDWANYPKGVVAILKEAGHECKNGFDVLYYGNIPNGAGLSSSASIEMVTGVMLNDLNDFQIDMIDLIKFGQKTENEFMGVNSGIMDQFASGKGKVGHAILLDCQTLEYQYSPVDLKDEVLVIANTNKRRGLADSKYNERRQQCERALAQLQTELDIASLGQLTMDKFNQYAHLIQDETDRKRAKHAVSENERTLVAVEKLHAGDIAAFGQLMNESHISLRDDYEVTGHELDSLVQAAWDEGAVGARMTGAGFGGCTINLVKRDRLDAFIENVGQKYEAETGLKADFYRVGIGDGARKIEK